MSLWALALLILSVGLLVLLTALVVRHAWIRFLFYFGVRRREHMVDKGKTLLLWLVFGALSVLAWVQVTSFFPLNLFSAIINGVVWGTLLTLVVSATSSVRARKLHRKAGLPFRRSKGWRKLAWLMLGALLFGAWIPLANSSWFAGMPVQTSTSTMTGELQFPITIFDNPLVPSWSLQIDCDYSDFRTTGPWYDEIRVDVEVRDDMGVLISAQELDLNRVTAGFWMIVAIPSRQSGSVTFPVPGPGVFLFNLTTQFDKPIGIAITQMGHLRIDLTLMIGGVGTLLCVLGAWRLRRSGRITVPASKGGTAGLESSDDRYISQQR